MILCNIMAKNDISHLGKVVELTPEFTSVEIISTSACSACHAKGVCGVSEEVVKVVSVPTSPYANYKVGDEVYVLLKKSMGMKAVWISYVLPVVILMTIILSMSALHFEDLQLGLAGIAGVVIYYLLIYLFRNKLAKDFIFEIKER